jgi:hypothetical protein
LDFFLNVGPAGALLLLLLLLLGLLLGCAIAFARNNAFLLILLACAITFASGCLGTIGTGLLALTFAFATSAASLAIRSVCSTKDCGSAAW